MDREGPFHAEAASEKYPASAFHEILDAIAAEYWSSGRKPMWPELLFVDERGVWPAPDTPRPWHPCQEIRSAGDRTNVYDGPLLGFPFFAEELAAFMVDGWGRICIRNDFGPWETGPIVGPDYAARRAAVVSKAADTEPAPVSDPGYATQRLSVVAREALTEAYHVLRMAALEVDHLLPASLRYGRTRLVEGPEANDDERVDEARDRLFDNDPELHRRWREVVVRRLLHARSPSVSQPPVKVVPRLKQQETAILDTLVAEGFDPLALPPPARRGLPSPAKQPIKKALGFTTDVFEKAWKRLRADGRLRDSTR